MTDKTTINGVDVIDELEELNKQREFCKRLGVCEKKYWERLYYSTRKKHFEEISTLEEQSARKDERIRELEQEVCNLEEEKATYSLKMETRKTYLEILKTLKINRYL